MIDTVLYQSNSAMDQRQGVFISGGTVSGPVVGVNYGTVNFYGLEVGPDGTRMGHAPPTPITVLEQVRVVPRPIRGFLDREEALAQVQAELLPGGGAWLTGPPGCGLSALLRKAANLAEQPLRHGVVYLDGAAAGDDRDEVLRQLYLTFHSCEAPIAVAPQAARAFLAGREARFVLDRLQLGHDDLCAVADALSQGAVLIGAEGHAPETLAALALAGLPQPDALRLVAEAAGPGAEQAHLERIATILAGLPLPVQLVGRLLRAGVAPPAQITAALADRAATAPAGALALAAQLGLIALDADQRVVLAALAFTAGLTLDALVAVAERPATAVEAALGRLDQLGLVAAGNERYQIAGASLRRVLAGLLGESGERRRAAAFFFAGATGARAGDLAWLRAEEANLFDAVRTLLDAGQAPDAGKLAQAMNPALVLDGRWSGWGRLIDLAESAAGASGERALQAWVLHERGSRAGLLGDLPAAGADLAEAARLRQQLGDQQGLALTRHNQEFLGLLPPPGGGEANKGSGTTTGPSPTLMLAGLVFLLALGILGFGLWSRFGPHEAAQGSPTATLPPTGPTAATQAAGPTAALPTRGATAPSTAEPRPFGLRPFTGSVRPDTPLTIDVRALVDDPDGTLAAPTLRPRGAPAGGDLTVDQGALSLVYTPRAGFVGADRFAYELCDGSARCATGEVAITVAGRPLVARPITTTVALQLAPSAEPLSITLPLTIPETSDRTQWEYLEGQYLEGNPFFGRPDGEVSVEGDRLTYLSRAGATGEDSFTMTFPRLPTELSQQFWIETRLILGPLDGVTAPRPGPVSIDVRRYVDDPDGMLDPATLKLDTANTQGTAVAEADGTISYTAPPDGAGEDRFAYTVCDRLGACASAPVTVALQPGGSPLVRYRGYQNGWGWGGCGPTPTAFVLGLDPRLGDARVSAQVQERIAITGGETYTGDWRTIPLAPQADQPGQFAGSADLGQTPQDKTLRAIIERDWPDYTWTLELRFVISQGTETVTPSQPIAYKSPGCG